MSSMNPEAASESSRIRLCGFSSIGRYWTAVAGHMGDRKEWRLVVQQIDERHVIRFPLLPEFHRENARRFHDAR